jgi:hypothetical protein
MKKLKEKVILHTTKKKPFTWDEVMKFHQKYGFLNDDIIHIQYVEAYYSENNSYDEHFSIEVTRMVEETDEEYQNRLKSEKFHEQLNYERRKETYLRLKEEFDGKI